MEFSVEPDYLSKIELTWLTTWPGLGRALGCRNGLAWCFNNSQSPPPCSKSSRGGVDFTKSSSIGWSGYKTIPLFHRLHIHLFTRRQDVQPQMIFLSILNTATTLYVSIILNEVLVNKHLKIKIYTCLPARLSTQPWPMVCLGLFSTGSLVTKWSQFQMADFSLLILKLFFNWIPGYSIVSILCQNGSL